MSTQTTFSELFLPFNQEPTDPERLARMGISYLFKTLSAPDVVAHLRDQQGLTNAQARELCTRFNYDGYLLRNLKPYLFYCAANSVDNLTDAQKYARKFDVAERDILLAREIRERKRLRKGLKPLVKKYAALPPKKYNREIEELPERIRPRLIQYAYRKLRFIYNNSHNARSQEDIINDLMFKGLQTVMVMYPRIESREHASNLAIVGAKRAGLNLIGAQTSLQRATLVQNEKGDGFISRVISWDTDYDMTSEITQRKRSDIELLESSIMVNQIQARYTGKKLQALRALMGFHDPELSAWLLKNATHRAHRMPNDDLLLHLIERRSSLSIYEAYLCGFFGVGNRHLQALKQEVSEMLS